MRLSWMAVTTTIALISITTTTALRPPLLVSEELGCSPTLSVVLRRPGFFFDPLRLANDVNFSRLREAELKHGRIAMLAVVATTLPPLLSHFGIDWFPSTYPTGILHAVAAALTQQPKQQPLLTTTDAMKVIGTCGILETLIFVQQSPTDMPGDYGVGYFGLRDKGLHEAPLIAELEHGRLAMLGFVAQVSLEYYHKSIFFVPSFSVSSFSNAS